MTPAERERAALVLRARMDELGLTAVALARKADVDPATVRRLLRAETTATTETRRRLAAALDWPVGYGMKLVAATPDLKTVATSDLIAELRRRCPEP